jgi:hypothetical protein
MAAEPAQPSDSAQTISRAERELDMRMLERRWEWDFPTSPATLWPLLADTARFNEAAGLPRYLVTDVPQPDGSVRRIGTVRRFGISLS